MQIICKKNEHSVYFTCMIIGFLGKGGSGKSSTATQFTLWLEKQGYSLLAIDADHNMDFIFNLTQGEEVLSHFLGSSGFDIEKFLNADHSQKYSTVFLNVAKPNQFSLSPLDTFSGKYSTLIRDRVRIMAAGPQTDTVIQGKVCSHNLTSTLKLYLPLLKVPDKHIVVVDEKAGADGVTTGIVTGLDYAVVVCEPSVHSVKTAKQIISLLEKYDVPKVIVGNKISSTEDRDFISQEISGETIMCIPTSNGVRTKPSEYDPQYEETMKNLFEYLLQNYEDKRYKRTLSKFNS